MGIKLTRTQTQRIIGLGVGLLCAGLGTWFILVSHAATAAVATEPENGTVTSPANVVTDSTASRGKAIKFSAPSTPAGVPAMDGRYVTVVDQTAHKILVLDPSGNWSVGGALWSWSSQDSPEIAASDKGWFSSPTDARLVNGGQNLLVTAGQNGCGVALVRVSDKKVLFYASGGNHTHSAEMLPDGNIVDVSTTDNRIRVMSTDPAVSHFPGNVVESDLLSTDGVSLPHGVVWDNATQRLWTVDNNGIDAYIYNFNRDNPKLTKDPKIARIPLIGSAGGHDLYPVYGQHKLFMTDTAHTNILDLDTLKLSIYTPDPAPGMKAMSLNPFGQVIMNTYTPNVFFGTPGNPTTTKRPLGTEKIYKVRWWMPES